MPIPFEISQKAQESAIKVIMKAKDGNARPFETIIEIKDEILSFYELGVEEGKKDIHGLLTA